MEYAKYGWVNLHRHDCFSFFDGFSKPKDAIEYAKQMGQQAIGITNHGNMCGAISHYTECKDAGIKPIIGIEVYFQIKFNKDKKSSHLCLFAQNKEGYSNITKIITLANANNFYRRPIVDLEMLAKYNKGIIVTTACVAGLPARMVLAKREDLAIEFILLMNKLFEDRFYLEIMPYNVYDDNKVNMQKIVNEFYIKMNKKYYIPCILTCDSHYVKRNDYDTYQMMHAISKHAALADYAQRYMPTEKEVSERFELMHHSSPNEYLRTTKELADSVDLELDFKEIIPKYKCDIPSKDMLKKLIIKGLKSRGKYIYEYRKRLKMEYEVVIDLGFEDYFLLCYDIVDYARKNGIGVGPGRGSVCGSLLAYALRITDVDPILLGTDFERFLRKDKRKMPDIDIDFCQTRRKEVIDYICNKYKNRTAQIATFGFYKTKNLANDLAKVYEMPADILNKTKKLIKNLLEDNIEELDKNEFLHNRRFEYLQEDYPDFIKHFIKLYGQVKFIGKHAAGVAITEDEISNYCPLMRIRGQIQCGYDLIALSKINILKLDILGLATVSAMNLACKEADINLEDVSLDDKNVYKEFSLGNTDGIFQFEKSGAKEILKKIEPKNMQELIAATALNRPAPIQLGILDQYVAGKNGEVNKNTLLYKQAKETYGCVVYQEQVMKICRNIAHMDWPDVEKVMKVLKVKGGVRGIYRDETTTMDSLQRTFIDGAKKYSGMKERAAAELYDKMTMYLFNKGHGAGYSMISYYQMYLKHYYPLEFYYAILKHESLDIKREAYKACAVRDGIVILLPHINGTAEDSITTVEGEKAIQEGMSAIKNVGLKTAKEIERLGPYEDEYELTEKVPKRSCTSRVVEALMEGGAMEFDQTKYFDRVTRYNSTLYSKYIRLW